MAVCFVTFGPFILAVVGMMVGFGYVHYRDVKESSRANV
jgi:hypothetical protein